jgi:hypothetical protein
MLVSAYLVRIIVAVSCTGTAATASTAAAATAVAVKSHSVPQCCHHLPVHVMSATESVPDRVHKVMYPPVGVKLQMSATSYSSSFIVRHQNTIHTSISCTLQNNVIAQNSPSEHV